MNSLIASVLAVTTAGTLAGCAQPPQNQHGMMMGSASGPEKDKMMAMCMEHMQAMPTRRDGTSPERPPTR